ncbi:MAG: tetratricopeptide repeat protein [Thermodesulfobacteriota bacterium]
MAKSRPHQKPAPEKGLNLPLLAGLLLAVVTLVVYWPVAGHDFVNYDDPKYILENPYVRSGLTPRGLAWALTTFHASNWHPLTWLSHMLDSQLFGLKPGPHHLVNLLWHTANAVLLFALLFRLTKNPWPAFLAAALFAWHPLHVESVAWVAERKDVLSTFFWLLTVWAYVAYLQRPGRGSYLLVVGALALGLMAKPMLVTLPFTLLLLDFWPLGRWAWPGLENKTGLNNSSTLASLVLEKLPLFALTAVSCVITYLAQQHGGAMTSWERLPLAVRAANALVSYVGYIGLMFWPHPLAVLYPHPGSVTIGPVVGAALLLAVVTALAIKFARKAPYLIVGWLWYLGTLVPVIGIIQVGRQAMADRYTYVPLIGLFIAAAWGLQDLAARRRLLHQALTGAALAFLTACLILTWYQLDYWKNGFTLFLHATQVTRNNDWAHYNVANAYQRQRDFEKAAKHYLEALRINPRFPDAHLNLGHVHLVQGRLDEAALEFNETLRLDPQAVGAYGNLGLVRMRQGRNEEALSNFSQALRLNPSDPSVHNNMGTALWMLGRRDEAIRHFTEALRLKPGDPDGHNNLGNAFWAVGRLEEALAQFNEALRLNPNHPQARPNLANLKRVMGRP